MLATSGRVDDLQQEVKTFSRATLQGTARPRSQTLAPQLGLRLGYKDKLEVSISATQKASRENGSSAKTLLVRPPQPDIMVTAQSPSGQIKQGTQHQDLDMA
jgi:hypothetical protein